MTTDKRTAVIEKIRKLLALASNEGATPGEAANAMSIAAALMERYKVEQNDIDGTLAKLEFDTADHQMKGDKWKFALANVIARSFNIKLLIVGSGANTRIRMYGTKTSIEAYKYLIDHMLNMVSDMAKRSCPKDVHGRVWNGGFGMGVTMTLHERVGAAHDRQLEASKVAHDAGHQAAIVLVRERDEVQNYYKDQTSNIKKSTMIDKRDYHRDAVRAGKAAGHTISLGSLPQNQRKDRMLN